MGKILALRASLLFSILCFSKVPLEAADHFIDVYPSGYFPNYLVVAPGDNVFWINQDDFAHSVTSTANLWQPGYLFDYQDVFGLTFTAQGTYSYYCAFDGFTGTIVVSGTAPPNDQCSSAIVMTAGTLYTVSTTGATSTGDPSPSCASLGKGVWYSFTPAANGLITISTCTSDFDTVLSVYTGSCGSLSAVPGGCNDDNGVSCAGSRASVAFTGTAGTTYRILAGGYGGAGGNLWITATNAATTTMWPEAQVSFNTGPSIARTTTNLIHLVDSTNDRLLTLDTASGNFISSIRLFGKFAFSGLMCFSLDEQFLYVPLSSTNKLQVISLATLTTTDLVPLTISPASIAAGSDGALYAANSDYVSKIEPTLGQNMGTVPGFFYSPLIKANNSGTRLYIMELGLSGGSEMIDEYAIMPSAVPLYVTNHFNGKANDMDFVIAEDIGWLYSTSGGVYGVGAWNMNTRTYSFWPYDAPYGVAVAMTPNGTLVYGASGSFYSPRIRAFNRLTGVVSNTFDLNAGGRGDGEVYDRSLKVTPNGRVFYARFYRKIGLIGGTALSTNTPVTLEIIDAGTNKTVTAGEIFSLSAIAPAASVADTYLWSQIAGPGQVTIAASNSLTTTAQIDTPGNYTLEIMRTNSGWVSRDRLYVTALSRPVRFDPVGLNAAGQFQMRLRSDPGSFQIQASTNFVHWETITNVFSMQGDITITDSITNRPYRFYRARLN